MATSPRGVVDHSALKRQPGPGSWRRFSSRFIGSAFSFRPLLPVLIPLLSVVLLLGTFAPQLALFKQIYFNVLKPRGIVKPRLVQDRPEPHNFAQGMGGVVLAIASLFLVPLPVVGLALSLLVAVLAFHKPGNLRVPPRVPDLLPARTRWADQGNAVVSTQLWALAAACAVVLAAAGLELWRSSHARARALGLSATTTSGDAKPYILYFTGESCSVCRTHQEPALAKLSGVRIDKVDAIAEREFADRFPTSTPSRRPWWTCRARASTLHVELTATRRRPSWSARLSEARGGGTGDCSLGLVILTSMPRRFVLLVLILLIAAACGQQQAQSSQSQDLVLGLRHLSTERAASRGRQKEELAGVNAALQLAESTGVLRTHVRLQVVDATTPQAAASAAVDELVRDYHVPAILGTYGSTLSAAASARAEALKTVYWETGAVADPITAQRHYVFRTVATGSSLGRMAVTFTHDVLVPRMKPATPRVVIVRVNDIYGRSVGGGEASLAQSSAWTSWM